MGLTVIIDEGPGKNVPAGEQFGRSLQEPRFGFVKEGIFTIEQAFGASTYTAEYQAVLDRATALGYALPDTARQTAGDQFIRDIGPTIWAKLKLVRVYRGPNAQFVTLNWKSPSANQATLVGESFTAYGYVNGNNTTAYIDENFIPANEGLSAGSQSYGMMIESAGAFDPSNSVIGGSIDVTNGVNYMYPSGPVLSIGSLNFVFISPPGVPPMMIACDRYSTTSQKQLKNGVQYNDQNGTSAITGTGIQPIRQFTSARNNNGFADFFNSDKVSFVYYAQHLTDAEHLAIYNAFASYRSA